MQSKNENTEVYQTQEISAYAHLIYTVLWHWII